jgi:alpha-glucosidase
MLRMRTRLLFSGFEAGQGWFQACLTGLAALFLLMLSAPATADTISELRSPNGQIKIEAGELGGRPFYRVSRADKPVIANSRLGFMLADQPKLDGGFAVMATERASGNETWEQPWGEARYIKNHYQEMTLQFREGEGRKRTYSVRFRAFDDGIGFRYEFPDQAGLQTVQIAEEKTEFVIAEPGTAWWIPAGEWNRYEYLYQRTPVKEVPQVHTPMTIRTASGLHLSFHEAALVDYSAMWLRRVEGQRFVSQLSPSANGPKVVREAPFNTPWRTIQISPDAAGLVTSHLILNLNEPNALGDVSWVKPHKYVGIWWEMHINKSTWGSGPTHGATTVNAKRYIDFAARHGFRGVLIEGWNVGWDGNWFGGESGFDFTKAYPDFDLEAVAAYARLKNVRLIGHHETAANVANYEPQLDAALKLYARLGVDSIKTGYVADAGGARVQGADGVVRHEWHDGQAMSRHHLHVVKEAARQKIAINAHEPIKDTGLRRTYPNWVAREGARGQEYNAWGSPTNPPEHEVNLVFTRLLSGPMDYTPGIFQLKPTLGQNQVLTTLSKQLALYVALYSPIQMAADLPEHYEANMAPFQFIKDVPTDWEETRVLNGEVGDYVTIARKDRNSQDWFLGAITDENPRNLTVGLSFLTPAKTYRAHIYRDGPKAHFKDNPYPIVIETRNVTSRSSLPLALAPGGGQAVRFEAME